MSNPWDMNDPFDSPCETCGERGCLGFHEQKWRVNPLTAVVAVVIVVALLAGSIGFFLGARGNQKTVEIAPPSSTSETSTVPVQITAEESLMLNSVNAERAKESLSALTWCPALARSATEHSKDMAAQNYFEHEDLDGGQVSDRALAQGYEYQTVGENIAVGQRSVEEVMVAWMNSPGHRANIMKPEYRHFGSGVATGDFKGQESIYWTQNFGAGGSCN